MGEDGSRKASLLLGDVKYIAMQSLVETKVYYTVHFLYTKSRHILCLHCCRTRNIICDCGISQDLLGFLIFYFEVGKATNGLNCLLASDAYYHAGCSYVYSYTWFSHLLRGTILCAVPASPGKHTCKSSYMFKTIGL